MGKTIWFINDYAGSRYHGMEFRNYYFAKELVNRGHKVIIITASYMHLFKKLPKVEGSYSFEEIDGITYLWLKVPKYGRSTDPKRILKWFVFTKKLYNLPLNKMHKPDVIVASPMAPFLVFPSYKLAKRFKAKFFYEVKDIWPLSLQELGGFSDWNPLIAAMKYSEKFAIKRADKIISSLQNYGEHLKNNLNIDKEFKWICNGIDEEEMQNIEPLYSEIEEKIPKDKFIIGYTGTIGIANSLDTFCKAAKLLNNNKNIAFVLVGDGKEKKKLVKIYGELDNIYFIDAIPKQQVQSMLKLFDVCYIGLKKENLFKYGVSPNKLFDYMYSAKPILYSIESGKNSIIELAKCGITINAEESRAVADAVLELFDMPLNDRYKMGENGRRYVLEHFTYKNLAKEFEKLLEG